MAAARYPPVSFRKLSNCFPSNPGHKSFPIDFLVGNGRIGAGDYFLIRGLVQKVLGNFDRYIVGFVVAVS